MSSSVPGASTRESSAAAPAPDSSVPVARIDLSALAHNFSEVRRLVGPRTGVLAMIKSDAYGHGAALAATSLLRAGCDAFGVASVAEAADVAASIGTSSAARVMILAGILPGEAQAAIASGAEVATQEITVVRALGDRAAALGREASVHVKIDTGMHRLGIAPADAVAFVREAAAVRGVRVVAIFSHFAQAESVTGEVTAGQLERMLAADTALRGAGFELTRHLANSAAILSRPETHLDMVRPGIMLYGVAPDPVLRGRADLRPVMHFTARIVRVATIEAGEGIGYGHTYRTSKPTRVATLRCGYADGYPRCLGNVASCSVHGVRVPVVGRICMDHTMLDVSEAGSVNVGDEVTLWGADPAVDEVAEKAGTISYELLARLGKRVRREPMQPLDQKDK